MKDESLSTSGLPGVLVDLDLVLELPPFTLQDSNYACKFHIKNRLEDSCTGAWSLRLKSNQGATNSSQN